MSQHATDNGDPVQECVSSPPLPPDHVLDSGAVLFPGAFDQHGCPLIVFPADGQARLSSILSQTQVVDFITYFLRLHNKKQEKPSLASAVADLRQASLPTTRFIAETLLLLEQHQRTLHSVYIIQPKKKDAAKLLGKLLAPSKLHSATFKRVLLKEVSELSAYIDRSQLTPSLGGYFVYCHQSWVAFIKEIETFVQEFLSVVQQLPSCISMLQALSSLPVPTTFSELKHFCFTNEARFQQLRRKLGLDELLRHCESVVEKLRHPELEPCYQAMAGTALFTHTAFDMLQNYSRITAAMEKVELLWQQAFSKARLQLQVFQLRDRALQITEQIEALLQEKLQPYKPELARDAGRAASLLFQFEESIHTPAMALVRCAEDVIHTLAEILDGQSGEHWVLDLDRLKEKLYLAVHFILQTLRTVYNYHQYYNKASKWYTLVLCENLLQELLSGVDTASVPIQRRNWETIPAWRRKLYTFLKKNPPPSMEELLHLDRLSSVIPDNEIQETGKQMSQRCVMLRKLLISSGPVSLGHLQLALHWQYELLQSCHVTQTSANSAAVHAPDRPSELSLRSEAAPSSPLSSDGKPLSPRPSGSDGAGSSHLEAQAGNEGVAGIRSAGSQPQVHSEDVPAVSDMFDFGSVQHPSGASIQIIPKVTVDSLNFEIKVQRVAAPPSNPWLSLPVDDLENSYTVTITPNPTPQKRNPQRPDPSGPFSDADTSPTLGDQNGPRETEVLSSTPTKGQESEDWVLHSPNALEDSVLSPLSDMLSSTATDERDESVSTTQGVPTLLWDSYDLHQEAVDGTLDLSLKDWDVKEQEGLREVEKILERADKILQEEESVLAQEAVLDDLLGSEVSYNHWPIYYSEDNADGLSCSALSEAADLGLDDSLSEHTSAGSLTISESETMEADLLIELRIQDPGCSQEKPNNKLARSESLTEEGREMTGMEQCVDAEKAPEERDEKGETCSLVATGGAENQDRVCCGLLEPSDKSSSSVSDDDDCTTEHIPAELGPEEDRPNEGVPVSQGPTCSNQPQQCICEEELCGCYEAAPVFKPEAQTAVETRPSTGAFDPGGESRPRKASHPLDSSAESQSFCPELLHQSLQTHIPSNCEQLHFQDEALDSLPENVTTALTPTPAFNPNVMEQSNNNNNNNNLPEKHGPLPDRSSAVATDADETSSPFTGLMPTVEIQTSVPAGQHLEFDPGGKAPSKDLSDADQTFKAMRVPEPGSPGIHTQLDSSVTQVSYFKTPIVLDTGSGLMKAGFADQDLPSVLFPTIIGMPKYEEVMNGDMEKETYVGHEAQRMRGVLILKHPIKNGIIRNWEDMEKIWHHTFQQLRVDPEDHPVLLTEAAMNPLENRQRMVEIMFECFSVPFSYVAMQAVLALYASGRSTGVVFDSGDGVSHSVPVFEGYCLPHAVQRFPLAGADVTMQLKKLLQEQGVCMRTTAEMEIVREMKETCCCVALDYEAERTGGGRSCPEVYYTMPDGQVVTLGPERFRAPEILFKPELIGRDHPGMHQSIYKSILGSDIDLRSCLLGNIVLSGGNTLLPGLPERLQAEISSLLPANTGRRQSIGVTSPADRDFSVWSGGAVLANLSTFSSAWISRGEYEEYGPQIVFRKCF
ncbi:uncharacterized protein LOC114849351 [Betta splendens]|uniref:Uncharacterized protein LOC114849351 n=1 Tax=Betta splendens TaxID=158456 RepID=A0A6P7LRP4_BETSP|nr:uncharacterized protein LOC114849351 [Betta splendens]